MKSACIVLSTPECIRRGNSMKNNFTGDTKNERT